MKTYVGLIFSGRDIRGGSAAILEPSGCKDDVAKVTAGDLVYLDLEEHDERVHKVLALLAEVEEKPMISYWNKYTEDELQNAPLLCFNQWRMSRVLTGPSLGVSYDVSRACPTCFAGIRQASPLIVDGDNMLSLERYRVGCSSENDLLFRDADVEKLLAANVTGVNFWPISAKYESGKTTELRWQQAMIENILPPMAPSTQLVEEGICATCRCGHASESTNTRLCQVTYRREDLKNIRDFNVSWEWFGYYGRRQAEGMRELFWGNPWIFVTPKVMNLLRGKTKKEQNNQGCGFSPIWIEDEKTA